MVSHPTPAPVILPHLLPGLAAARRACRQRRTADRVALLSLGALCTLGRHTLSQTLVALGVGAQDWSAWYRVWSTPGRVDLDRLQTQVVAAVRTTLGADAPIAVALDATHLPRSSARLPGVGWARCPRTPAWKPGIHRAQRWVGLNALLPRSPAGDSRAVPLRWAPAPTPTAVPIPDSPPQPEWQAGIAHLTWLRDVLDRQGEDGRCILAVADGAYSSAPFWRALPDRTTVVSRCARNRALYALPPPRTARTRGRPRKYGERLPTPHDLVHERAGWRTVPVMVRGRRLPLVVKRVGPVLVKPAAEVPLYLLIVKGVRASRTHRQRPPTYLLVNARQDRHDRWVLPSPVAELLAWAWQRWEVEVLHRELKAGFGVGQQQAWSARGTVATTQWVVWLYALVVLAGYRAWGYQPPPGASPGRWWTPRRWSLGTLWAQVRTELWRLGDVSPGFARAADTWTEMTTWLATQTAAVGGYRRI